MHLSLGWAGSSKVQVQVSLIALDSKNNLIEAPGSPAASAVVWISLSRIRAENFNDSILDSLICSMLEINRSETGSHETRHDQLLRVPFTYYIMSSR